MTRLFQHVLHRSRSSNRRMRTWRRPYEPYVNYWGDIIWGHYNLAKYMGACKFHQCWQLAHGEGNQAPAGSRQHGKHLRPKPSYCTSWFLQDRALSPQDCKESWNKLRSSSQYMHRNNIKSDVVLFSAPQHDASLATMTEPIANMCLKDIWKDQGALFVNYSDSWRAFTSLFSYFSCQWCL